MDMKRITTIITLLLVSQGAPAQSEQNRPAETFPCLIAASAEVEVGSPVTGILGRIEVERSDKVDKGQVVARLKSNVERRSVDLASLRANNNAEVEAARTALEHATREKERAVKLYRKQLVSRQFLDKAITEQRLATQKLEQARSDAAQAREELKLARAQLQQRVIRSPISGVVAERYLASGQRVQDAPILKIVSIDPLKVDVVMPATYFSKLERGQTMKIKPEIIGLEENTARVTIIDRFIDSASNTFRVTLEMPNPGQKIPPGARCSARIDSDRTQASVKKEPVAVATSQKDEISALAVASTAQAVKTSTKTTKTLIINDTEYDPADNPFIQ